MNGNGRPDFSDIVTFFINLESPEIKENAKLFDFNGNGGVDFGDIVKQLAL